MKEEALMLETIIIDLVFLTSKGRPFRLTQLPGVCLLFSFQLSPKICQFLSNLGKLANNINNTSTCPMGHGPFPSSPPVTTMSELVEIDEALLDTDLEYRYQYLCQFMEFTDKDVQLIHGTISHPSWPSWLPL